jgi:hypothetical protein
MDIEERGVKLRLTVVDTPGKCLQIYRGKKVAFDVYLDMLYHPATLISPALCVHNIVHDEVLILMASIDSAFRGSFWPIELSIKLAPQIFLGMRMETCGTTLPLPAKRFSGLVLH